MGTWSEQVLTNQDMIVKFDPRRLTSFVQAAAVVLPAGVAMCMLHTANIHPERRRRLKDAPPLRRLIIGAGGGIGSALTKILSTSCPNVHVTGVCGAQSVERVLANGAHEVYDYNKGSSRRQLKASGKERFDIVLDTVGGLNIQEEAMHYLLKPSSDSAFVTCVGPFPNIGDRILNKSEQTWFGYHLFVWVPLNNLWFRRNTPTYHFADIRTFSDAVWQPAMDAHVEPVIDRVVPMEEDDVQKGLEYVMSSTTKKDGRVALAISSDADQTIK